MDRKSFYTARRFRKDLLQIRGITGGGKYRAR
jgi:hypothetical protein